MLRPITLDEVVEVTGGALVDGPNIVGESGEEVCTSVSTDTRTIEPGALFVALKGENHDAHDYLVAARERGATALLVGRALTMAEAQLPHVVVNDTLHALGDIARDIRDDFHGPVVGVTGSVGKTTAKEMIATVLGAKFHVHKSAENFNNEIGVPQTIFSMTPEHTALVVEMGMRGAGQIRRLAEIAAPTIGVITNIGLSHVELLGSREAIADAKGELFECLPETNGVAIYPAQDGFAERLRSRFKGKSLSVGVDGPADVRATEIERKGNGFLFRVDSPMGSGDYYIPTPGEFNILNALFAIAAGESAGLTHAEMADALKNWTAPPMRMEVLKSEKGTTILSDAYNAAPDSMIGALQTLQNMPVGPGGKRIAVLGEMRELGAFANDAHSMVGRSVGRIKPDMLVVIGEMGRKIAAGAMVMGFNGDKIHQIATAGQAASIVPVIVGPNDVVLVKGSRALKLEQIVEAMNPVRPVPPTPEPAPNPVPAPSPDVVATEPPVAPIEAPVIPIAPDLDDIVSEPVAITPETSVSGEDAPPSAEEVLTVGERFEIPDEDSPDEAEDASDVVREPIDPSLGSAEDAEASADVSIVPPPILTTPEGVSDAPVPPPLPISDEANNPPPLPVSPATVSTVPPPLPAGASEPEAKETKA